MNFGWFKDDEAQRQLRERLAERLRKDLGLDIAADVSNAWPNVRPSAWCHQGGKLVALLAEIVREARARRV